MSEVAPAQSSNNVVLPKCKRTLELGPRQIDYLHDEVFMIAYYRIKHEKPKSIHLRHPMAIEQLLKKKVTLTTVDWDVEKVEHMTNLPLGAQGLREKHEKWEAGAIANSAFSVADETNFPKVVAHWAMKEIDKQEVKKIVEEYEEVTGQKPDKKCVVQ